MILSQYLVSICPNCNLQKRKIDFLYKVKHNTQLQSSAKLKLSMVYFHFIASHTMLYFPSEFHIVGKNNKCIPPARTAIIQFSNQEI